MLFPQEPQRSASDSSQKPEETRRSESKPETSQHCVGPDTVSGLIYDLMKGEIPFLEKDQLAPREFLKDHFAGLIRSVNICETVELRRTQNSKVKMFEKLFEEE